MDRYAFEIFGIGIAWYGVILASAMLIGSILLVRVGKRYGYAENDIMDLLLAVLPAAVIGSRLYYVAFQWEYYVANPSKILAFREGGLAIHGGIIGGLIAGYIVCKVKKLNFWDLADMVSMPLILGQAIGRWGNYVNHEAHGGPTDLPWGIVVDGVKVHPTFLYESLWNLGIFIFLVLTFKKRKAYGTHFMKYLMLYSIGRFFIEGMRTDSLMLGPLRIAQVVSVVAVIVCAIGIYRFNRKPIEPSIGGGNGEDTKNP